MGYKGRRYRRRSGNEFGSMVGDTASIANSLGPRGALVVGVVGFIFFYFLVPALLTAWLEHNQAKMSTGVTGQVYRNLMETIFSKRFIRPSELAGIAVLLLGVGLAIWKTVTQDSLSRTDERDASFFARLLARFLD